MRHRHGSNITPLFVLLQLYYVVPALAACAVMREGGTVPWLGPALNMLLLVCTAVPFPLQFQGTPFPLVACALMRPAGTTAPELSCGPATAATTSAMKCLQTVRSDGQVCARQMCVSNVLLSSSNRVWTYVIHRVEAL
jgi:hypothetical protein